LLFRKYKPITTREQRRLYKTDFQAEYEVYKVLKEKVDSVSTKFTELENKRQQFPKESVERKVRLPSSSTCKTLKCAIMLVSFLLAVPTAHLDTVDCVPNISLFSSWIEF